jgi:prophage tail gpP-like protein
MSEFNPTINPDGSVDIGEIDITPSPPPPPPPSVAPSSPKPPDNTVSIVIGGQSFTGWKTLRITRSLEKCPPTFGLTGTDRNATGGALAIIQPGSPCQVMIGSELVLTGYVDRYGPRISPKTHDIRVSGRGKCEDLVDCSVTPDIINGMKVTTSTLLALAQRMVAPFGAPTPIRAISLTGGDVPVTAPNGGAPLGFNATLQETPWEILSKVARYAGVLIYEGTDGNLLMANVGTSTMASGFSEGVNVQDGDAAFTMDERYSEYLPVLMSTNMFGQKGIGGTSFPKVYDKGVPRFRPLIIVSEQFQWGEAFAERRAQWEMARRLGRSNALTVVCDSWRDSAKTLWAVNAFAPIDLPTLKLTKMPAPWIIGAVSFIRDDRRGTVAELLLMPKEAFQPEPTILVPWLYNPNDTGGVPAAGGGADPTPPTPEGGDGPIPGGAPGGSPGTSSPPPAAGGGAAPGGPPSAPNGGDNGAPVGLPSINIGAP